jgi:hypothetical protein
MMPSIVLQSLTGPTIAWHAAFFRKRYLLVDAMLPAYHFWVRDIISNEYTVLIATEIFPDRKLLSLLYLTTSLACSLQLFVPLQLLAPQRLPP